MGIHILPVDAHFPFDPNRSTEFADFDITEIYWRKTGKEGLDAEDICRRWTWRNKNDEDKTLKK